MKFFSPAITGSETFYEKLQKIDWYYMDEKDEYDFARHYIEETNNVLDIGCGKGTFAKKIKTIEYTGLELSREAGCLAEKKRYKSA